MWEVYLKLDGSHLSFFEKTQEIAGEAVKKLTKGDWWSTFTADGRRRIILVNREKIISVEITEMPTKDESEDAQS